ncbi:protein archease-like [Phymastichus coffea]|uniref:protein archease-like n=1 Tax=Phymastichus coffea TaxID=108790 RepID=UPI00273ACE89|nr:protein archease-like [Phymastichus coffea]
MDTENDLVDDDFVYPPCKYEYLDHTADVQLHSWGDTLQEAFEQCAIAMFNYMTDLERVELKQVHHVEAEGHDLQSLLFHFLDELLFMFSAEPFLVAKKVKIITFDRENFKIVARAVGEEFEIGKHTQGAEVKAITYSAMQIHEPPEVERPELFVIVDI